MILGAEEIGIATTNERYYTLLLPALQLMNSLMIHLRDSHYTLQKVDRIQYYI
jgi:hypothetical protein